MSEPTHIRSDSELARRLGVNRASVAAWRKAGLLAWTPERGFDLARCRTQVAERLAGRLRGRTAADSERALAELRKVQTATAELRLAVLRGSVVPAVWVRAQWRARCSYWTTRLAYVAEDLAPGLVGLDARMASLAIESALRRACDAVDDEPAGELPTVDVPGVPADELPTVETGEAPRDASERWLGEKRLRAVELARVELARVRGALVDLEWVDATLAGRAIELRRTLQGIARTLPQQLRGRDEAGILAKLREAFTEAVEAYARPLPRLPRPCTTEEPHEQDDADGETNTATSTDED